MSLDHLLEQVEDIKAHVNDVTKKSSEPLERALAGEVYELADIVGDLLTVLKTFLPRE